MLRGWICQMFGAAYALAVSIAAGRWAVCYSFECRGYQAVGSEYLFILAVYLLAFRMARGLIGLLEKKKYKKYQMQQRYPVCKLYREKCGMIQRDAGNIIYWYEWYDADENKKIRRK